MRLRLKLAGRVFEVEVGDLSERPIVATVDGQRFEVWPEEQKASQPLPEAELVSGTGSASTPPPPLERPPAAQAILESGQRPLTQAARTVQAPIPGVIDSVAVKAGDVVTAGQTLCVLEAMKMKNVIRAPRSGEVAAVHVQPGQQVRHYEPLVEFVE